MSRWVKPVQLGNLKIPHNVWYAPLAGCSDYPFRRMAQRGGAGLLFCEMVKMDALVRYEPNTLAYLDYDAQMHPIGAQLCGSKPDLAGPAARILEDLGFDIIDFNCGCPVDKVTKDGSGSAMLKHPELIAEILVRMVAAVRVPVTVKVRAGWDHQSINAVEVTRLAEEAGAQVITVHGRTRSQSYQQPADWGHIKACKQAAKRIQVVGNGDILNPEDAIAMFEKTGCDGVLVSRGTLGKPWIAEDICRLDRGEELPKRSWLEEKAALLQHLDEMCRYYSEERVIIDMRRVGCWYITGIPHARELRGTISKAASVKEIRDLIRGV